VDAERTIPVDVVVAARLVEYAAYFAGRTGRREAPGDAADLKDALSRYWASQPQQSEGLLW